MSLKKRVAARIRTLRERRDLTQERLGELIDRSSDAVSQLERGISLPSFTTLERLSEAFGCPIRDFFDFGDEETTPKRAAVMAALVDAARSLGDDDLEVAARQIEALAARRKMAAPQPPPAGATTTLQVRERPRPKRS